MSRKIVISLVLVFILSFGPLPRPSDGKASPDLQTGFFSAGDLDPTFGEGGKLILPNVSGVNQNSLAIQPDGKLLLAVDGTVLRFLPDGSPDSSFGGDGRIETSLGVLILQPDGKILMVGTVDIPPWSSGIGMMRYLPDGNPDTSFGEGGRVYATYGRGISGSAAGLQPDGKILVTGMVFEEEPINYAPDVGVFVARFSPGGSLDPSFDQDGFGINLFMYGREELTYSVNDLAVLPDGKIVVVGTAGNEDHAGWLIRLFNSDGSFHAGVGAPDHGPCLYCFDDAYAVVVQPDGKFLVGGGQSTAAEDVFLSMNFYLLRFNPDASLDESFGEGGEVYTDFPSSDFDVAHDIALQEDGKIIAVGETIFWVHDDVEHDFALARYQPDGSLDEAFGEAGLLTTDFGGSESAIAVALQPDGKIVAAGYTEGGVALARYLAGLGKWTSSFDQSHGWTVQDYVRTVGDVNGDGRDDLVGFGLDGVYVSLSTGSSFPAPSKWVRAFDVAHGWTVSGFVRTVGDVNGDGRDDLVGFGLDGVYVSLSTGSGFSAPSKWAQAFDLAHGWTVSGFVRTVGDVNGDGRDDLVGFGLDGVYVSLSTGSGFPAPSKWTSAFDLSHGWTVSDFVRTVGDVNGDGKADLIGFGLDGVYVSLSTGSGFPAPSKWTSAFDLSHGWTVAQFVRTVGDVNGDGMADLVGFGLDGVYIALSTGGAFGAISRWTNSFDLSHGWTVSGFVRTVGDVTGNGTADLVGFGLDGVYIATSR